MISKLTNPDVIEFIQENLQADPAQLVLSASKYPDMPIKEVATQIASRKKAQKKLPEWTQNPGIIFPPRENLEQASSEKTASFKSDLFTGNSFLDLTGGTGIDTFYISKSFSDSIYVEPSKQLCDLALHNFEQLGADIEVVNADAATYMKSDNSYYDLIYLDPSRRTDAAQRVIDLREYQPNVIELLPRLLEKAKRVLIKVSPMIDIKQGISLLKKVDRVICLAVNNEMKEVLFEVSANASKTIAIEVVNIAKETVESVSSTLEREKQTSPKLSRPLKFLYEPNSAIRKAGLFNVVGDQFTLPKLDMNTHLYTSGELKEGFPGRCFQVIEIIKADKKTLKAISNNRPINVISKNYPLSATEIKKKYNLKDGGSNFFIFTSSSEVGNIVLYCSTIY